MPWYPSAAFSHERHEMKYHHKLSLFLIFLLIACFIVFKIGKAHETPKHQVVYYSEKFDIGEDIQDDELEDIVDEGESSGDE